MSSKPTTDESGKAYSAGTYLRCSSCGSEIQVVKPCGCNPPDQVLRCCDRDMVPTKPEGERGFLG